MDDCHDQDLKQDVSVELKIQDNMQRGQWLLKKRFKTRCKRMDDCHDKDSKQDVSVEVKI